ncbi:vWA domain-containing protein [Salinilacihabitans rarus]|uniref:vWA domain-containing protein n=1 Tax=Salinilacihabitans rarus TaxID=2961596 RepID=UPI0020C844BF|nr:vWA domain-containing protein [Salinilacihabitans rarus]
MSADEGFVEIVGTDPSTYPEIDVNVRVDSDAGRDGELTADDFEVYEDGERVEIIDFEYSASSLDLVFVFDDSGSMGNEISSMKRKVKGLTEDIDEAGIDARYGLVSFRDDVDTDLTFTDDADALKDAVDSLEAYGGGDFPEDNFDAIVTALEDDYRDDAQKIVVDITDATSHYDGDDSGFSEYTLSDVATALNERGASFVAVSPGYDDPDASLKVLAEETGGLWIDIGDADFDRILDRISDLVVELYVLRYESDTEPGGVGEVGVEVEDPDLGTDSASGTVSVPEDTEPTVPSRFTELASEKSALAEQVDENSLGILDDTGLVSPVIDALRSAVESGDVAGETATASLERLRAGEQVTDAVLAGAGPGSSEYNTADTNLAKATARSAVNPMIELLFAGISVVRAARHLPFVGGAAKRAARYIADLVADAAGKISSRLERIIRAQGEDAGFALLGEVESRSKSAGKPIAEDEFREARSEQSDVLVEDNVDVLFEDYLFNEEYDWFGNPTEPLDESLYTLVEGVDPDTDSPSPTGDDEAALSAAETALEDVNDIQRTTVEEVSQTESILKAVGVLSGVLAAAALVAGVTGIGSPVGVVLGAASALLGIGVSVPLTMANWGLGVNGMLGTRYRHQTAVDEILHPEGGT